MKINVHLRWLCLCCLVLVSATHVGGSGHASDSVSGDGILVLVPAEYVTEIGPFATILHDYGSAVLARISGAIPPDLAHRLHPLIDGDTVSYRSWSGPVDDVEGGFGPSDVRLLVKLIGPMDLRWRDAFVHAGVTVVGTAHPHALVVRADAESLARATRVLTTAGHPVIRGIRRLPVEARVHRSLVPVLLGDRPDSVFEVSVVADHAASDAAKEIGAQLSSIHLTGGELIRRLESHPEIAYIEPVFSPVSHNNLAARTGLISVEPVWDLGYNGTGVVVSHNDTGVDLEHPDLVDVVIESFGRMTYADTAHGTHTAGSIAGRGLSPAPENSSNCGDLTQGLPVAAGMARNSEIVTNNIFEEGHSSVDAMMAWAADSGAHLSSNSWGLSGLGGPEVGYSSASVQADAAVRDADAATLGDQPLSIFFSAGNTGPAPGTVTAPGTAKNVITIGAVENDRCGAWVPDQQPGPDPDVVLAASGRGPSQGRLKPDLAAPGSDVLSLESGDAYAVQIWDQDWTGPDLALNTGTSQACALAAGAGAVLHEAMWRNRGRRPSPALLKAVLIAAADAGGAGADFGRGWGRLDARTSVQGLVDGSGVLLDQDETAELVTGMSWNGSVVVGSSRHPLGLALVWTDPPGEEDAEHPLVNDLDLSLTAPSGAVYRGNVFSGRWSTPDPGTDRDSDNNVEVIRVEDPEPGDWNIRVFATAVPQPPVGHSGQDFAIAVVGDAWPCDDAPSPPAMVEADVVGANRIRVQWTASPDVTQYEVSRSDVSGGHPYEPIATVSGDQSSFVDTQVSGGSAYHYVVRTLRSCWSSYSAEASVVATGECRLAPTFAGISTVDESSHAGCSLDLSWAPAVATCPGAVQYRIYRSGQPGFTPGADTLLVDSWVGSSFSDEVLEPGLDYSYIVRARHLGQTLDDGNWVELGGRPMGPVDVFLRDGAEHGLADWTLEPGSLHDSETEAWGVTQDDSWEGETAFFVADEDRVKDQVLLTAAPIALVEGSAPILEFHHRYRTIKGRDGGRLEYSTNGGLDWYDILSGDGQTVPDDPERWRSGGYTNTIGAPTNPLFREDGWTGDSRGWVSSSVDLADFAGRRLLLRWRMGCDETPGLGWGWWIDQIRLVVEHECLSCAVTSPDVDLIARSVADGVELEWLGQSSDEAYRLSRANQPAGPFQVLAEISAPQTTYLDSSASGGTDYTYAIAVGAGGCWTDDSQGVTTTAGGPCKLPPLFWGLDEIIDRREATCALDLAWRAASPGCSDTGLSYRVYRSLDEDFEPGPQTLLADGVVGERFRDLMIDDGVRYHYRVRAIDPVSGAEDDNLVQQTAWTTGPEEIHFIDSVEGDLSEWWTGLGSSADSGTEPWVVASDLAFQGSRSWFCANEARIKDQVLGLSRDFLIDDATTELSFFHLFDLEPFWDGGRLEYSTDGGASWHDMLAGDGNAVGANPNRFVRGAYTGFVSPGTGHPFGGEKAWTGFLGGWIESVVDLSEFVGLAVRFRWRLGCDQSEARVGWWVDDVVVRTTSSCRTGELPEPREISGRLP